MTLKQELALKRGLFKRSLMCAGYHTWAPLRTNALTDMEREKLMQAQSLLMELQLSFFDETPKLGFKRRKIKDKNITII